MERLLVKEALTMKPFRALSTASIARSTGLALLASWGIAAAAGAADVPVRYRLQARPLYATVAGTLLSFELYSDSACTNLVHTADVPIGDVAVFSRLTRVTPQGATKPPRTAELIHTLTGVPSGGPLYLAVSGAGVVPVPATAGCQIQVAGAGGPGGSGPSMPFKRTTFEFSLIPPAGQPAATLTWFHFTPPVSGTAVLRARGYCNLTPLDGSNNQLIIGIGTTPVTALTAVNVGETGFINVPPGAGPGVYQEGWSAERTFPVTAGQFASAYLVGRHEAGNATNDCSGSLTVEIFSTPMP
jgi:hypothetical protein